MTKIIAFAMIVIGVAWWVLATGAAEPSSGPAMQPSTQPAKELTLDLGNKVTMKLVEIPAGKFLMGSPETEKERDQYGTFVPYGTPPRLRETQHEVTISKPFYLGVYEVTQEQYEQVVGRNPSTFKGARNPVETVSWEDAAEFCQKLSQKTGKTVSLPTDAQWEYACRAGTTTPFHTGQTISTDEANYNGNYVYGNGQKGKYNDSTIAVGTFKPNAWGLYDMHGNVWEWCSDWYSPMTDATATDPAGPASGGSHVARGGCWRWTPGFCRSAFRYGLDISFGCRSGCYGFRVAVAAGVDSVDKSSKENAK